ncbi:MAG: hypothetical protein LBS64_05405 [Spirochaetaceae bacterium]|jgi:shikimate kinase|nr:hypothetical protein [Spirochaetaceae bacterium]
MERAIILTGIKHSGKTTIGRILAARLDVPFHDTDHIITGLKNRTPREIMTAGGAQALHRAEKQAVCRLAAASFPAVIATGGGICDNPGALEILNPRGIFVFLDVPEDIAVGRILDEAEMPAYIAAGQPRSPDDVRRIFHRFYRDRTARYRMLAHLVFAPLRIPAEQNAAGLHAELLRHLLC